MDYPKTKESIYVNGCQDSLLTPKITSEDIELATSLLEYYNQEKIPIAAMKKRRALLETKVILNFFFKLHDVWQLDEDEFFKHINEYEDYSSLKKAFQENGTYISPYDIHITYVKDPNYIEGDVESKYFLVPEKGEYQPKMSFRKIHLVRNVSLLTPPTYAHELFHTQLQSRRGVITQYENIELLSYFVGLLVSYEMDAEESVLKVYKAALNLELIKLTHELKAYIEKTIDVDADEIYETNQYFLSIKRAYELFIIYYSKEEPIKKEIITDIQTIIDGNVTLEEILSKYQIGSIEPPKMLKYIR